MASMSEQALFRCFGGPEDPLMMRYHDEEWGAPIHDDNLLFEFLTLEGAQAGLSWQTILRKRENYRRAFHHFAIASVASYSNADAERLLADPGIVRNRLKVHSTISNAQRIVEVQQEFGSFDRFIWQFTDFKTLRRPGELTMENTPTQIEESAAMSQELRKRGFRFVGPTICYAFMQAVGMVNDHMSACIRAPKG